MALQGPIDTYFDAGMCSGAHSPDAKPKTQAASEPGDPPNTTPSLDARLESMLTSLDKVAEVRTNPRAASDALKRHLRRQAEDKLRFAYQLDPAHYANYNSLHFFLTEPQIGTRPELTPSAAKLADETIQYCLKQDQDPRPALTAASAATNILHLMFADAQSETPKFSTSQMHPYLNLLDHCIARYVGIARQWDESKQWDLLSPQRIHECEERFGFICRIRDAAEKTILRLEQKSLPTQASN